MEGGKKRGKERSEQAGRGSGSPRLLWAGLAILGAYPMSATFPRLQLQTPPAPTTTTASGYGAHGRRGLKSPHSPKASGPPQNWPFPSSWTSQGPVSAHIDFPECGGHQMSHSCACVHRMSSDHKQRVAVSTRRQEMLVVNHSLGGLISNPSCGHSGENQAGRSKVLQS
jgi:hypothetical protein